MLFSGCNDLDFKKISKKIFFYYKNLKDLFKILYEHRHLNDFFEKEINLKENWCNEQIKNYIT